MKPSRSSALSGKFSALRKVSVGSGSAGCAAAPRARLGWSPPRTGAGSARLLSRSPSPGARAGPRIEAKVAMAASVLRWALAISSSLRSSAGRLARPICAVVHALFAGDAYPQLQAVVARVVSCDSVPHPSNAIPLAPLVAAALAALPERPGT